MQTPVKRKTKDQRMSGCVKNLDILKCFLNRRSNLVKKKMQEGDIDGELEKKISYHNRQLLYLLGITEGEE
jgi:hypothetical protein